MMIATRVSRILDRMADCAVRIGWDETPRQLLHAYAACLTPTEIGEAALLTLDDHAGIRAAIRNRLQRLGREGAAPSELDALGRALLALEPHDARQRTRIDALLAQIYPYSGAATRQAILERWRDRGTSGALARWIKAMAGDETLFDSWEVVEVWRRSRHSKAAALLASHGDPDCLAQVLQELASQVPEGWIVSRAALRAAAVTEPVWETLRARFPASYAYLCARTGRVCPDDEALALVNGAEGGFMGDRGLAIWAVGQMGKVDVLDRLYADLGEPLRPLEASGTGTCPDPMPADGLDVSAPSRKIAP